MCELPGARSPTSRTAGIVPCTLLENPTKRRPSKNGARCTTLCCFGSVSRKRDRNDDGGVCLSLPKIFPKNVSRSILLNPCLLGTTDHGRGELPMVGSSKGVREFVFDC
jgi:hypothetical protein